MATLGQFSHQLWHIVIELAPWLFLGTALAACLHVWMPKDFIKRHLGGAHWLTTIKASLLGVPMPLCSCSVIPTGIGLKKDGAGNGASVSFLIATPQTGVDSVFVTAAFLGWPFALYKVLVALVSGILGGLWVLPLDKVEQTSSDQQLIQADKSLTIANNKPSSQASFCEPQPSCCDTGTERQSKWRQWWHFAIFDLLHAIWLWLVIGIVLSAALSTWLPVYDWPDGMSGGLLAMVVVLLIAIPLYVCDISSVPIAAALVANGMPIGAALVFLMAGPATNIATIGAIGRGLGWTVLYRYIVTIVICSVICGLLYNTYADVFFAEGDISINQLHDGDSWLVYTCALCFIGLTAFFAVYDMKRYLNQ